MPNKDMVLVVLVVQLLLELATLVDQSLLLASDVLVPTS